MLGLMLKIPRLIREAKIKSKIMVRPHPSESKIIWQEACHGLDNIVISCEEPINNVLLKTGFLIHNRCTTGIEGFLSKVKVVSYEPVKLDSPPSPNKEFINSFANYICESELELVHLLKKNNLNYKFPKESKAQEYLYNLNSLSSSKIVDVISKRYSFKVRNNLTSIVLIISSLPLIIAHHIILKIFYRIFKSEHFLYIKQKSGNIKFQALIKSYKNFIRIRFYPKITLFLPTNLISK